MFSLKCEPSYDCHWPHSLDWVIHSKTVMSTKRFYYMPTLIILFICCDVLPMLSRTLSWQSMVDTVQHNIFYTKWLFNTCTTQYTMKLTYFKLFLFLTIASSRECSIFDPALAPAHTLTLMDLSNQRSWIWPCHRDSARAWKSCDELHTWNCNVIINFVCISLNIFIDFENSINRCSVSQSLNSEHDTSYTVA